MSTTRISTSQLFQNAQANVGNAREKEIASAEKAATNKEIVRPSQNPSGWLTAASVKDDLSQRETIAKNASMAQHALSAGDHVLSQVQESLQRAKELALSASGSGPDSATVRQSVLGEVKGLYDGVVQSLNTRYGDRTLFAGFKSQGPAFDGAGNFLGDAGKIEIEIASGVKIPVNIPAGRAILGEGKEGGVNVIQALQRLVTGLSTNDEAMIRGTLDELTAGNAQLSEARAEVGAHASSITRALDSFGVAKQDGLDTISKVEEADAIKVFSDLARDQTVMKAAVATSQKLLSEAASDPFIR